MKLISIAIEKINDNEKNENEHIDTKIQKKIHH